ncbi:MAG TPA: Imm1 family immunity protein [Candidatus Limnocylindrales bacterium]
MLRYHSADGEFVSFAPWDADSEELVVAYNLMGTADEFPPASEIPLDHVRHAVKEFLASGGQRPQSVQWQEDTTL